MRIQMLKHITVAALAMLPAVQTRADTVSTSYEKQVRESRFVGRLLEWVGPTAPSEQESRDLWQTLAGGEAKKRAEIAAGLDEFVGFGDGLTVGVHRRPHGVVVRKGYASDSSPASSFGSVRSADCSAAAGVVIGNSTSRGVRSRSTDGRSSSELSPKASRNSGVVL